MRWTSSSMYTIVAVLVLLGLCAGTARALDDLEKAKIEYLVSSVEHLKGAKFVRNGSEYDGREAAAHLRMKFKRAGDRVRSAEDFIDLCASKSYLSGKPYRIVFSDGQSMPSGEFFRKKLRQFNQSAK
jgi:hypothetical protein